MWARPWVVSAASALLLAVFAVVNVEVYANIIRALGAGGYTDNVLVDPFSPLYAEGSREVRRARPSRRAAKADRKHERRNAVFAPPGYAYPR